MIKEKLEELNIEYKENVSLKEHTTYKVGGKASFVVYPKRVEELKELMKYIFDYNIKYKVIGGGSNLIFKGDFKGIIIKLDNFNNLEIEGTRVKVGAGYSIIKLAMKLAKLGLGGLEWATGVPGTVGGCTFMNAGAYKKEMKDIVKQVIILDNGEIKTLSNEDMEYEYRSSILKRENHRIILEVILKMEQQDPETIMKLIEDRKARRNESQPLEFPSAGSVFRNPEEAPAWKLIDECNLKGIQIGDAKVSEKHANFIINNGSATGEDVIKLIHYIQKEVKEKYDIELKFEQEIIE